MSFYNRESELGAGRFGNAWGAVIGAGLLHWVGWWAVGVYAGINLVAFIVNICIGAKKAAA